MEVITSHINLDFDGFASMIAAKKLYPNAQLVLPNVISKDVRNFLALYRGFFELNEFKEINIDDVTKVIVVDTSSHKRVIDFSEVINNDNVEVIVYDHHIQEEDIIRADYSKIERYGACTSILLNKIKDEKIEIRPFEATILALGIYTDTNCLTFSSTTLEDARAVTYLLECGAYLDVVSNFVGQPLSTKQKEAFEKLTKNIRDYTIKGFEVGISAVEFDEYIDEIAYITYRILSLEEYDAVFSIVCIKNTTYIVGRSNVSQIKIHEIMKEFEGSGHPKAGSAKLKSTEISNIEKNLVDVLNKLVKPAMKAKDIVSYPVKTVTEDISLNEVDKIMLRHGHTGLPVVKQDEVIGIITRRDIEKAIHLGYGNSPVKAYMSKDVVCVSHDTPIKEMRHKMIENNIGRLPVLENGKLVGLVTRTDILRQIFGKDSPDMFKEIYVKDKNLKTNYSQELNKMEDEIKSILVKAGEIGDKEDNKVFIVGGFVRDILLGHNNLDIDIVVVGDGIQFARDLCDEYDGKIKVHEKFKTAAIEILDKYKIDIVTARREFYEYPAALPTVEKGSIRSDLYRRDFTINSMAICLNKKFFGQLIDYFGGQRDLQDGLIRVLYNMSFVEDPTRIFRAIRFANRYDFRIENQTNKFIHHAIDTDILKKVSSDRIIDEILFILQENNADKAILHMISIGIFSEIYPKLNINDKVINMIKTVKQKPSFSDYDTVLVYLLILFSQTSFEAVKDILENLKLTKTHKNAIIVFAKNKDLIEEKLSTDNISNYELYTMLNSLNTEIIFLLKNYSNNIVAQNIDIFEHRLKDIQIMINGKILKELGINSGPKYKAIFRKVFEAKLNKELESLEDEIEYVKKIID